MANEFGEMVTKARIEQNLSQRALAQKIGKSATYITYVESGHNPASKGGKFQPGKDAVEKIAKVLGLDINTALLAAGYAPTKEVQTIRNRINVSDFDDFDDKDLDDIAEYIALKKLKNKQ